MSVAEATRNVAITGARPLGVTNCLNFGDPTRPEAFWQLSEAVRGLVRRVPRARPAGHRRQRLAVQRVARLGDRADARDRRRRAARRRRHARRVRRSAPTDNAVLLVGEIGAGLAGSRVRAARRRRARGRPAGARPRARGALQAFIREADRPRPRRELPGRRRAAASRWRSPRWHLGRRRARPALAVGDSPAVDAVRREPVAPRRRGRARATCRRFDAARAPARAAGRRARRDRRRAAASSSSPARAPRAPPRSAAPDRRRPRGPRRRPAPRLGPWPAAGARLGRQLRRVEGLMCGVVGVVLPDRGHEAAGRRRDGAVRAPAPRPGVGRRRGSATARSLMVYKDLGMVGQVLDERRIPSLRATSPSPTAATRRPARRSGRTPSRRSGSGRGGRSPSATTATSSTPASCWTSSRAAAAGSPAAPTRSC